jgi:hypothetical protein
MVDCYMFVLSAGRSNPKVSLNITYILLFLETNPNLNLSALLHPGAQQQILMAAGGQPGGLQPQPGQPGAGLPNGFPGHPGAQYALTPSGQLIATGQPGGLLAAQNAAAAAAMGFPGLQGIPR